MAEVMLKDLQNQDSSDKELNFGLKPILSVKDLKVSYRTERTILRAVDGITFDLFSGDSLGIVGESGCGKSTLGFSIIKLLKGNGQIDSGKIYFKTKKEKYIDITSLNEDEIYKLRGNYISMVFQAAQDALNPLQSIKNHLIDTLKAHYVDKSTHKKKIETIFKELEIPISRLNDYPFQFSGGMLQRISIALALILEPELIICDEPTTALDVLVQSKILSLLKKLKEKKDLSMIFISHDLGVIADISNRVAVMYAGQIVEIASTNDIFGNPRHPYTKGLLSSVPNVLEKSKTMKSISGSPPDLKNPPQGCRFNPRCEFAKFICSEKGPILWGLENTNHFARCHIDTVEYNNSEEKSK